MAMAEVKPTLLGDQPFYLLHQSETAPRKTYPLDVLLIKPNNPPNAIGFQNLVETDPLGLQYVGESIREMVKDVQIHDDAIDPEGWRQKINGKTRIFGISCTFVTHEDQVIDLAKEIREAVPDAVILVGGFHAGENYKRFINQKEIDAVSVDSGYKVMPKIVKAVAEGKPLETVQGIVCKNQDGDIVSTIDNSGTKGQIIYDHPDMDARPYITGDLVAPYQDYYHFINHRNTRTTQTATGCPDGKCIFCSVWTANKRNYFTESVERTVKQIEMLTRNGSTYVVIVDDSTFNDPRRNLELAEGLRAIGKSRENLRIWAQIKAGSLVKATPKESALAFESFLALHGVGLDMVLMGIESSRDDELQSVGKEANASQTEEAIMKAHAIGIQIWGAQLVWPDWDEKRFDEAIAWNKKMQIEAPQFTLLTPLPKTILYKQMKKQGKLSTMDPKKYGFYFPIIMPTNLPLEEFMYHFARLFRETGPLSSLSLGRKQVKHIAEDIALGFSTEKLTARNATEMKRMGDPDYYRTVWMGSTPVDSDHGTIYIAKN